MRLLYNYYLHCFTISVDRVINLFILCNVMSELLLSFDASLSAIYWEVVDYSLLFSTPREQSLVELSFYLFLVVAFAVMALLGKASLRFLHVEAKCPILTERLVL